MVGNTRQGWALLGVMLFILIACFGVLQWAESSGNPLVAKLGVQSINLEGKDVRFGMAGSNLFTVATTGTSCGAVNTMHDSLTPIGGMMPLSLILLGEIIFGGVGSGLYTMLAFAIIAVFVSGLMIGRTPEYLGKKIESYEMKMASLLILIMPLTVLMLTAVAVLTKDGQAAPLNPGPHGFSEILYAYVSQGNNNGSAFAGLTGNTVFYNLTGSLDMLISRFWLAVPTLALAGSLAQKKKVPAGAGTLSTTSGLFIAWVIGVIILVGALNFVPALGLGPIIEHLIMIGR
jgi:K+-transporting ATPase ATPase A chain